VNEAKCNVKVTRARFKTDWANIGKKVATLLLLKMLLLNSTVAVFRNQLPKAWPAFQMSMASKRKVEKQCFLAILLARPH